MQKTVHTLSTDGYPRCATSFWRRAAFFFTGFRYGWPATCEDCLAWRFAEVAARSYLAFRGRLPSDADA